MRLRFLLLLLLALASCARVPEGLPPERPIIVRVAVAFNASESWTRCSQRCTISPLSGQRGVEVGKGAPVVFRVSEKRVEAFIRGRQILSGQCLRLAGLGRKGRIRLGGSEYRGGLEVFPSGDGLTVVNELTLEDYVRGVLPAEMGRQPRGRIEALKAQAIAARSYALANMGRRSQYGFDFFGDIRDQAYCGAGRADRLSSKAVEETAGLVATYEGRPISAFYCANCGGHTASIQEVWDGPAVPYLQGVRDTLEGEDYSGGSCGGRWTETWTGEELRAILNGSLPEEVPGLGQLNIGLVRDLAVVDRSASGRVGALEIRTSEATYRVHKDDIRRVLLRRESGHPILRSTCFTLEVEHDGDGAVVRARAVGRGNGHGVGMCQSGALGMADRGYTAQEILKHYYQGIEITRWPSRTPGGL